MTNPPYIPEAVEKAVEDALPPIAKPYAGMVAFAASRAWLEEAKERLADEAAKALGENRQLWDGFMGIVDAALTALGPEGSKQGQGESS